MSRLTDMQKAFVIAMIEYGGLDYTKAARAAGYKDSGTGAIRVHAHYLAHDERIQEAIKEEGQRRLNAGALMAVRTLLTIVDDPTAERKDRLKAAEMIMNRTGLHATSEHKVAVVHKDESGAEMVKRIEQLSKNLGLDSKKLLGGMVVEAEFEEVGNFPSEEKVVEDGYEYDPNSIDDLL